ncbi:MAG: thiol-activated cytolysin family protein [Saprospiraceae bacterium]
MKSFRLPYLTLISLFLFILACKKENVFEPKTFDEAIEFGGDFDEPQEKETIVETSTDTENINGETWKCVTETKDILASGGGRDGFPLFSPNSGVVFPGNLLQGASLLDATPKIIAVDRAGGTISTDVIDGNIQSSFSVNEIKKSSVTDAINNIINTSTGVVPANFSFKYDRIQSREEFALKLGVDVETAFTDLEANMSFSSDKSYNRYFVQLNQTYYTMSYDIPTSLEDIFAPSVKPGDLTKYVGPGNPAAYISDVTYGRIYYMLIESTSSTTELDVAIQGSFNGIATKVEGDVDVNYFKNLKNLKIQVYAFGGDAQTTLLTVGVSKLPELRSLLAKSTDIRTGKPISYVVRSVYDNQIVNVQLATKYDVKNCVPTKFDEAPAFSKHWYGIAQTMGPIGAAFCSRGTEMYLISKDGTQYMKSDIGTLEGPFPISQLGDGTCPLTKIGAACNLEGNKKSGSNEQITVMAFDETGTKYAYMFDDGGWSSNLSDVSSINNGTCPFNASGVGALAFYWKDEQGPSSRFFFNQAGDKYCTYTNNPQKFGPSTSLSSGFGNFTNLIPDVGAAIGFYIGNDKYYVFFSKAGTEYVINGNLEGTGVKNYGPFPI